MVADSIEVIAERCVHSRLAHASCRACIEACPQGAWSLAEQALTLDADRCDGCLACATACPTDAIPGHCRALLRYDAVGVPVAFAACAPATGAPEAMPCLHAVPLEALIDCHRRGVRLLLVSHDCRGCPSARADAPLSVGIARLNEALGARGEPAIELRQVTPPEWARALAGCSESPAHSRRAFLRRAIAPNRGEAPHPLYSTPDAGPLPWAVDIINADCTACAACTRICPTGAIALGESATGTSYQLRSERCNGCRLCVDICPARAVRLMPWTRPVRRAVPLSAYQCRSCASTYYRIAGKSGAEELCPVCRDYPPTPLRLVE